jgi:hypothetical protein
MRKKQSLPEPVNKDLYTKVKHLADKKFTSKSGIYGLLKNTKSEAENTLVRLLNLRA